MVFSRDELRRLTPNALKRLAQYLDVPILPKMKKEPIIDKILDRLITPVVIDATAPDNGIQYLPGETPERPLYSAKIRRIIQSKLEGEK